MASNPFLQLDVLHNRYKMNKPLTDCYRLIFHRKLWSTLFAARKEEEIESSWLHCLSKKGRLYTPQKVENTYLYSVVTFTLSKIFIPHEISRIYVLQSIKNWKELTHFFTGTISSLTPKVLQQKVHNFLQATIQDSKFNQLVMRLLKWTRQSSASKEVQKFLLLCERLARLQLDKEMRNQFEKIGIHAYYVRYDVDVLIGLHGKEMAIQENPFLSLPIQFTSHRKKKRVDFLQHRITAVRKANEEISHSQHLIQITIPKLELIQFSKKYGTLHPFRSKHRPYLMYKTEEEIRRVYQRECTDMWNFYKVASNKRILKKVIHLAKGSFLKTIAGKRKSTVKKVIKKKKDYSTVTNLMKL